MNINAFSKLNSRSDELEELLESLKKELEDTEEIETEMELVDEEELIMCVIFPLRHRRWERQVGGERRRQVGRDATIDGEAQDRLRKRL